MEPIPEFGPIEVKRREGDEAFHDGARNLGFDLAEFWRWNCSDLVSNATSGILAEYLVAKARDVADGVREEWAAYDLATADGTRIEVKSAAYIQTWHQNELSSITFRIPRTRAWDKDSNRQSDEVRRQADVYVFAVLAHQNQSSIDPLDVSQWDFLIVPTAQLDNRTRSQHSITLSSLRALAGELVRYSDLRHTVQEQAETQRSLSKRALQTVQSAIDR